MNPEKEALLKTATTITCTLNSLETKWFVCFGTLLALVRDNKFNLQQDIDIGVVGNIRDVYNTLNQTYNCTYAMLDDHTKLPICAHYTGNGLSAILDVFFWQKFEGHYWHSFDINHDNKPIPDNYDFRGVPAHCFNTPPEMIKYFRDDTLRYGNAMNQDGTWNHAVPGLEADCIDVRLPYKYGELLDIWYPDWATRRIQFGTSMWSKRMVRPTCRGLWKE